MKYAPPATADLAKTSVKLHITNAAGLTKARYYATILLYHYYSFIQPNYYYTTVTMYYFTITIL